MKFIARNLTQQQPMFSLIQHYGVDTVTRSHTAWDLMVHTPYVTNYRKTFCYSSPIEWNKLPAFLKASQSFPSFKTKIKNHFLAMYPE